MVKNTHCWPFLFLTGWALTLSILSCSEKTPGSAQEGGQLKAFMAGTGRTGHNFHCWKPSGRDHSCCLSFVIRVGFCQIGSWQHQCSSFFQVGVWDCVKAVHPSPGSHAGKGAARHNGGRLTDEARVDLFAGANLLLADSTGLCSSAAVPEQAGNCCHYPWDWSSPASQTPSTPPRQGWSCTPASGKDASRGAGSVPAIAQALRERKCLFDFADCFTCAHYLCLNKPWKPGKQVNIHAYLMPFMRAPSTTEDYSPGLMLPHKQHL